MLPINERKGSNKTPNENLLKSREDSADSLPPSPISLTLPEGEATSPSLIPLDGGNNTPSHELGHENVLNLQQAGNTPHASNGHSKVRRRLNLDIKSIATDENWREGVNDTDVTSNEDAMSFRDKDVVSNQTGETPVKLSSEEKLLLANVAKKTPTALEASDNEGQSIHARRMLSMHPTKTQSDFQISQHFESSRVKRGKLNTLWNNLMDELTTSYEPTEIVEKQEAVYNFVQVPHKLERLLLFGVFLCFDSFLFLFTIMPIRIVIALVTLVFKPFSSKNLTSTQVWDLMRAAIVLICFYGLMYIDTSRLYHYIRGQAVLKLYVIFNVLEIFDKLCCSFGQDIFASLFWKTIDKNNLKGTKQYLHLHPVSIFLVALVYTSIHALVLFYLIITLNVAMNSHNNALLTLLISNQFVELKGSVFKKFEMENLFQISCSDMVERFQLLVMLMLVTLQNFSDLEWQISGYWDVHLMQCVIVCLSELIVDWVKHAFITKFNKFSPIVYNSFKEMLTHDVVKFAPNKISFDSQTVLTRIGFLPLPLACMVVRMVYQVYEKVAANHSSWLSAVCVLGGFGVLCVIKMLVRQQLVRSAMKNLAPFSPWSDNPVPDRFSMCKGKIP